MRYSKLTNLDRYDRAVDSACSGALWILDHPTVSGIGLLFSAIFVRELFGRKNVRVCDTNVHDGPHTVTVTCNL